MKKFKSFWVAMLMALFVGVLGSNNCQAQIYQVVEEFNKQMPMSLGMAGEMTRVSINGGFMEMIVEVNEDVVNLEALKKSTDLMHENIVQMISNGNVAGMGIILDELIDSELGMKLVYIGKTTHTRVSASITHEEIKLLSAHAGDPKNPDELLDAQIRLTNIQLPMDLDNGMTMEKLVREGNYVVYCYSWDDDMVDLLKASEKEMKAELLKMLKTNDPSIVMFNALCKDAGVGMAYRYVGRNKGNKATIYIKPSEF